jgi:uncharacterized membrane protein HdeD (DUF308 family)
MKILQSSFFRAICAIAVGILLIKYPDNTVTWITVAIGVLFFLSGIISLVVYFNARKNVSEYKITDADGNIIGGERPTFPVVGVGSIILGAILALTPNIFITALMYIIGGMLILGAVNQFMSLVNARKFGKIGFGYWIFPSVILLTGLYVIIRPMDPASVAMLILGWCTLLYGVTEMINSIKFHSDRRKYAKAQEIQQAEVVQEAEEVPVDEETQVTTELADTTSENHDAYLPKAPTES